MSMYDRKYVECSQVGACKQYEQIYFYEFINAHLYLVSNLIKNCNICKKLHDVSSVKRQLTINTQCYIFLTITPEA